ncbi:MAG: hypothetical protein JSW52_10265 [Candidatus Coatesbacteria bacterium]|nr:MAG: hypothetical protein JSW52_10265 [Candidatus Coatesbacteria bacterium]
MRPVTILAVIFVLTTLMACTDTVAPRINTPAQVLEFLEESFNRQELSVLYKYLRSDFVFYFDPDNVGDEIDGFTIPVSWDRYNIFGACSNMFEEAYSIDFEVVTAGVGDPDDEATTYSAYNVQIRLVVMTDALNGHLADGYCDFEFIYNGPSGYGGYGWEVSKWYDRTSPIGSTGLSNNTTPKSLGLILAYYY